MPIQLKKNPDDPDAVATLLALYQNFADTHDCAINPDEKHVNTILRGLLARERKFGQAYCPCRVLTGDPTTDNDIVCPCVFRENDLYFHGRCHCKLFVRKE